MPHPVEVLDALLKLADVSRTQRAAARPVRSYTLTSGQLDAQVEGSGGRIYFAHIRVEGQRCFRCTCPDHQRQLRGDRRPCKHVISLAIVAGKDLLRDEFDGFDEPDNFDEE